MIAMKKAKKSGTKKGKCPKCGGELMAGCLMSGNKRVSWKKGKFGLANIFGRRYPVDCNSCKECGHVEFYREVEKK